MLESVTKKSEMQCKVVKNFEFRAFLKKDKKDYSNYLRKINFFNEIKLKNYYLKLKIIYYHKIR